MDMLYGRQTLQQNRLRGLIEDEAMRQARMMRESAKDANLQLMELKREKEKSEREQKIQEEREEIEKARRKRMPKGAF